MSRRAQGKLRPLTRSERGARAARNERRGRVPRERRWERDHIVKSGKPTETRLLRSRSKASLLAEAVGQRMRRETIERNKAAAEQRSKE